MSDAATEGDISTVAPAPYVHPETAAFWEATAAGKLMLGRCTDCDAFIFYPRSWCPACGSGETELVEASGTATIYSYTINYKGEGPYAAVSPYVLAYVELEEGPRMMTNIVGAGNSAPKLAKTSLNVGTTQIMMTEMTIAETMMTALG